jgi:hypothetical protein
MTLISAHFFSIFFIQTVAARTMASKFESARTEDWRSLAEANRLAQLPGPAERKLALEGKGIGSRRVRQQDEDTRPNVFGARNLAIVAALLAAGYYIDGVLSGTRLDGSKGGPFRRMLDGLLSPLLRLARGGRGGKGGRGGWKEQSPAEMARLAAEKRNQSGGKRKKRKGGKKR